jgi:hypothetical protein
MKIFIKLKHWQIFIILGTGFILNLILSTNKFSIGNITSIGLGTVIGIFTLILFFLWVMTIGIFINRIPANSYHFRTWVLIFATLCNMIGYSELNLERILPISDFIPIWLLTLLTLLTFFGIFYTFYNVPKSLKSIELGRKAHFSEYFISALLLFIFPIGVWFIQPRINRIYNENEIKKIEEIKLQTANKGS